MCVLLDICNAIYVPLLEIFIPVKILHEAILSKSKE